MRGFDSNHETEKKALVRAGLLPARISVRSEEILPSIEYWHYRSGVNIAFFFCWITTSISMGDGPLQQRPFRVRTRGHGKLVPERFSSFREKKSEGGHLEILRGSDLIIANVVFDTLRQDREFTQRIARLDFSSAVVLDLERLKRGKCPGDVHGIGTLRTDISIR